MYTINNNIENEIIVKKSKFITKLYYAISVDEINAILSNIKTNYKDATHICYAYILLNSCKYFDDKEPKSTAGFPMYNILEKNKLVNVLAVTIRYYGGIKLGAGLLTRTYARSVNDVLKLVRKVEYENLVKIKITTKYENKKLLESVTSNLSIVSKSFDNDIIYEVLLSKDKLDLLLKSIDKSKISII